MRRAWEDSPALVAATSAADHVLVFCNAAAAEVFGARPLGVPLAEAFDLPAERLALLSEVLTSGRTVRLDAHTAAVRDGSGESVVVSSVLSPWGEPGSAPAGVVMSAVNLTAAYRAERAASRGRLLADLSAAVAAARDPAAGLQALTDALVPDLADAAAVYVIPDGAGSAATGPDALAIAPDLARLGRPPVSPPRAEPAPLQRVLAGGQPVVVPIASDTLGQLTTDAATAGWLEAARTNSLAIVPLVVAGRFTGALLLLAAGERPAFTEHDLPFLTDVTARAGAVIAQQRTVLAQRQAAMQLQHALLPPAPPTLPGLAVAARYLAGAPDAEVGGDWWEVAPLEGSGRVALGIGDVSGRGITAAAVMGQARAAMRAASHAHLPPAEVLTILDTQLAGVVLPDQLTQTSPPRFATACYLVVEPALRCLRAANAGHLPLLIRGVDGQVRTVALPAGAPLGLLVGEFTEVEVPFHVGETVALFTDGLVESRHQTLDDGLAALAGALAAHGAHPDLDVALDRILEEMSRRPGWADDDIAVVLARQDPGRTGP